MLPTIALALAGAGLLFASCEPADPARGDQPGRDPHRPPAVAAAPATLRIGTWNLEHFGQRDLFQDRPGSPGNRTPDQVRALAGFLLGTGVDLLAVQEIGGPRPLRMLLRHLGPRYRGTLGTTGVYRDTRISVGFIWNADRVEQLQCQEMAEFPSQVGELPVFHRKPVNAVFRVVRAGATVLDFRAIVVHLTASRDARNEVRRQAEVRVLRAYLADLLADPTEDRDVLVLGDFNHTYGAPAHRLFTAGELVRYAGTPAAPGAPPSPSVVWFDEPIDHIALTAGIRDEVVADSYRRHNQRGNYAAGARDQVTGDEQAWRLSYSDHYPVTLDLRADRDRDPLATFRAPARSLPVLTPN